MSVTLRRTSPDGEMGFPGNLDVSVVFTVSGTDLTVDYRAITDAPTAGQPDQPRLSESVR